MNLWEGVRRVAGIGVGVALLGAITACGTEIGAEVGEEPQRLTQSQFLSTVDRAVTEAGGLSWSEEELPDPEGPEGQQLEEATGVMIASDPVQSRWNSTAGELVVTAELICHQGIWTRSELPLAWPAWPEDRPWNCLPPTDRLWVIVGHPSTGVSPDPMSVLSRTSVGKNWQPPVATGEGEQARMRYEFDGHQVWLDSDNLPRRMASTYKVWTIEPDGQVEITLPPERERTSLSPGVGRGHVGSCCLPMGEPPTQG